MTCQQILAFAQMVQTGQEEDRNGLRYLVESFEASTLLQYGGRTSKHPPLRRALPVQDEIAESDTPWNTPSRPPLLLVADRPDPGPGRRDRVPRRS